MNPQLSTKSALSSHSLALAQDCPFPTQRLSLAEVYEEAKAGRGIEFNHRYSSLVVNEIEVDFSGKVVLDAACGTQNAFFADRLRCARRVIGIDYDRHSIQRNRMIQNGVVADVHSLPLADNSVDCIVSVDTIEHVHRPQEFLRECHRVLVPGGQAVFTTPCLLGYKTLFARYCGKRVFDAVWRHVNGTILPYDSLYRVNTPWGVRKLARESGLLLRQLIYVPEISWFFHKYPLGFATAYAVNGILGGLHLQMFWNYMAYRLERPAT